MVGRQKDYARTSVRQKPHAETRRKAELQFAVPHSADDLPTLASAVSPARWPEHRPDVRASKEREPRRHTAGLEA
jgi:hypothetical protein